MTLYLHLLKAFLNHDLYTKYFQYINQEFIKENYPELFKLFQCLIQLHADETKDFVLDDLVIALSTYYPSSTTESYHPIFTQLKELPEVSENLILTYLDETSKRVLATQITHKALAVSEGRDNWESLQELIESSKDISIKQETENEFVEDNLDKLKETHFNQQGLRWRLTSLNQSLGSLRKSNFGFIFARPEAGKTTFLASEITYMASQVSRPILWFNNEQDGRDVITRCYQGSLGLSLTSLYGDTETSIRKYKEETKGLVKIIDDASLTKQRVERLCKQQQPALIIFDQLDKIKGFSHNDRNDIELKNIYVWARELAKTYAPVIAVCQAGATGEGKRWLTMADVDNSKTGKQGEADWILGIGKVPDEGLEYIRYFHLLKNKLIGDQDTNPELRHNKWEVRLKPDIARYEDF